ncbi:hypothetical protein OTU49_015394, partial [Cherax quadricarinatus]
PGRRESPCVGVGGGKAWAWQSVYTVVVDAGATATRAHVFSFLRCCIDNTFLLQKEDFYQVEDSLLHYVNAPHQMRALLLPLLKRARATVPDQYVKHTPLILRATPSLRRLPRAHATRLIYQARKIVTRTAFMVKREHVTIMAGHDEAADLWLAANFLTEPNMAYGFVRVEQFRAAANTMCSREPAHLPDPLACLDYQYVAALLTHGLHLDDHTEILVCEKIHGFRPSWALGAALDYLQSH